MNSVIFLAILASWPVRIAVLGDRTGCPDDTEFDIAVEAIVSMSPDLILSVGDFVEGYGEAATALEDWSRIRPLLDMLESAGKVIWVPGNNDIWDDETLEMWMEEVGTEPSGIQRAEGIDFLVWDSSRFDWLDADRLSELEALIEDRNPSYPWILVTHKPFWFMADQDEVMIDGFYSLMERTSPLAVVAGHIHLFAAERRAGILYVSAGPSGSEVASPDAARGKFTQLGWMTVFPDSVAYTVLDARGVYSEELNTGQEQLLAYLYSRDMLEFRPLDQAMESATVTLTPMEPVNRSISLSVDPGCWGLSPDTAEVLLGESPVELHFSLNHVSGFYPLPVLSVMLEYGDRDKTLEFDCTWPVRRRTEASSGQPVVDGQVGSGEYPSGWQSGFADQSGNAAEDGLARFAAMSTGETLSLLVEAADAQSDPDTSGTDCVGIVIDSGESIYWLKVYRNGETSATLITGDWEFQEWTGGFRTAVGESGQGWSLEADFSRNELGLDRERVGIHVYRVYSQGISTWAWPLEFARSTMGEIWFGQAADQ